MSGTTQIYSNGFLLIRVTSKTTEIIFPILIKGITCTPLAIFYFLFFMISTAAELLLKYKNSNKVSNKVKVPIKYSLLIGLFNIQDRTRSLHAPWAILLLCPPPPPPTFFSGCLVKRSEAMKNLSMLRMFHRWL